MSANEYLDHLDEQNGKYEELLLSILHQEGQIEPFLNTIFNFLYRRTDFFLEQETPEQRYGFRKGVAKQVVLKNFEKYDRLPKELLKKRLLESDEKKLSSSSKTPTTTTTNQQQSKVKEKEVHVVNNSSNNEELQKQQERFQNNSSSYNGAIRDAYSWTQSIKDVDVHVNVTASIKTGKQVKVKIDKEFLQVSQIDAETNTWEFLINEKLAWKIKPEQSTWSLLPGEHIHVYLEKVQERWWENLLESESKLDLKFMNPEKPMEDLDDEAQAKIKQMMYDEQQKRLGLPTSEQQRQHDVLRKAWDLDGSPFKGMPFDPSVLEPKSN